MKKNINEFMPYVLPVATIFFLIVFFISSPAAISQATSITGFFAREPSYALAGKLEITEYEYQERNCSIDLEVLSEDITINRTISLESFLKKAEKNDNRHTLDIEDFNIILKPGNYDVLVVIRCSDKIISQSQERVEI